MSRFDSAKVNDLPGRAPCLNEPEHKIKFVWLLMCIMGWTGMGIEQVSRHGRGHFCFHYRNELLEFKQNRIVTRMIGIVWVLSPCTAR